MASKHLGERMTRNHAQINRRSTIVRWSVYALTALALCAVPVSFWLEPNLIIERVPAPNASGNRTLTLVFMTDGVFMAHRYPQYQQMYFGGNPLPGRHVDWSLGQEPFPPIRSEWNHFPSSYLGDGSGGPNTRIEIPTVPMAFLLVLLSGALWWRARINRPPGLCKSCGYSLADLTTTTCPECGVEHG